MSLSGLPYIALCHTASLFLTLCFLLHTLLYLGQVCHVTRVTLCCGEFRFSPDGQQSDWGLGRPQHWLSAWLCVCGGVVGWGILLTERIWWAGKDIHCTKALKSLFRVGCKSPHIQQRLSLAACGPVLDGFLADGSVGPSRTRQGFSSLSE